MLVSDSLDRWPYCGCCGSAIGDVEAWWRTPSPGLRPKDFVDAAALLAAATRERLRRAGAGQQAVCRVMGRTRFTTWR
jgi:hypothetical protein